MSHVSGGTLQKLQCFHSNFVRRFEVKINREWMLCLLDRVVLTGQQLLLYGGSVTFLKQTDLQLSVNLIIMHLQNCITFRIIYFGLGTMAVCHLLWQRGHFLCKPCILGKTIGWNNDRSCYPYLWCYCQWVCKSLKMDLVTLHIRSVEDCGLLAHLS